MTQRERNIIQIILKMEDGELCQVLDLVKAASSPDARNMINRILEKRNNGN